MYLHMPSLALGKSEVRPPPGSPAGPAVQIGCHQSRSPQLCSRCHSPTTRGAQRAFQLSWTNFGKDGLLIQVILASHKDWTNKALCLSCNCCCCFFHCLAACWIAPQGQQRSAAEPHCHAILTIGWSSAMLCHSGDFEPFYAIFGAVLGHFGAPVGTWMAPGWSNMAYIHVIYPWAVFKGHLGPFRATSGS